MGEPAIERDIEGGHRRERALPEHGQQEQNGILSPVARGLECRALERDERVEHSVLDRRQGHAVPPDAAGLGHRQHRAGSTEDEHRIAGNAKVSQPGETIKSLGVA